MLAFLTILHLVTLKRDERGQGLLIRKDNVTFMFWLISGLTRKEQSHPQGFFISISSRHEPLV